MTGRACFTTPAGLVRVRERTGQPVPFGSHPGKPGGRYCLSLLALIFSTPAIASTLQEGDFVRDGRACTSAADSDRLVSNGHSVAPPGETCRVVSRTSTGGYYPILNQRCTRGADDYRMDVHISAPDQISVRDQADGAAIAYRYCLSRPVARVGH